MTREFKMDESRGPKSINWQQRKSAVERISKENYAFVKRLERVKPQSIPQLVLILADYQYKNAFAADHELNVVACMTEIMANVELE